MIKRKKSLKNKTPSRRKFFKLQQQQELQLQQQCSNAKIATAGAHVTLKMQAAWPSGANIFFEMAGDYCKMVSDMSGGALKD